MEADDIGIKDMIPPGGWPEGDRTITSEDIERAAPQFFEAMTAALWTKQGYRSHLTERADGGVDVVAIKGDEGLLVQCKSTTSDRPIGWEAVKDVSAGAAIYAEKFPTIRFKKIGVTNKTFNVRAHDRARANGVVLIEGPKLEKLALAVRLRLADVISAGMGTRV